MTTNPSNEALDRGLELAKGWERRPYVVDVAIGVRHRAGDFHDERCIVVYVRDKLDELALGGSRRRRFPSQLGVMVDGQRFEVPVDVQEFDEQEEGDLQGLVARRLSLAGAPIGAVGAVVVKDDRALVMMAGHVGRAAGRAFGLLDGLLVTTGAPRMDGRMDHVLAEPSRPLLPEDATLRDGRRLTGVRFVDASLVMEEVSFFHAASGALRTARIRTVRFPARFRFPGRTASTRMRGLIAIAQDTRPGDSGTLLFDSQLRAVGTLVGAFRGHSVFVPCDTAFQRLGVRLFEAPP